MDNQSFQHLHTALSLKSALQDVANREVNALDYAAGDTHQLTLKEFDDFSGQLLPTHNMQPVQMRIAPRHGQLIELKNDTGESILSKVIIPSDPHEQPYLKKLSSTEAATLRGTRHSVEVIHTANSLAPAPKQLTKQKKLLYFLEPAERLVFSVFSRILHTEDASGNAKAYLWELILILSLAMLALLAMWYYAISQL